MKQLLHSNIKIGVVLAAGLLATTITATDARSRNSIFDRLKDGPKIGLTRAPYIQNVTPTSAYIVWNTDTPGSSIIEHHFLDRKTKPVYTDTVAKDKVTRHIVHLTKLQPGTNYSYTVGSNGRPLYSGNFKTPAADTKTFSFAAWGDSGTGSTAQKELAKQIERQRPDFLVHTGDLIYNRGEQARYNRYFFDVYRSTLARVPFYGSLGNHDVLTDNGKPFLDNFVLPHNGPTGLTAERNYSFDYGNAHFVVIDSNLNENNLRRHIVPWVERDVKNSKAVWKFAVFHHPPYSSGSHGDEPRTQRALAPLFSRLKFDAVLNGHDHNYERFKKINGVVYIVTGAGGAGRRERKERRNTTAFFNNDDWSFTRIDINGRTLRGRQITRGGKVIDDWKLEK